MAADFLPYGSHVVEEDDITLVAAALRGDRLTTGPWVDRFEEKLAAIVGARFAVACVNGTAALHLAALALDLPAGARVAVPSLTFLATANAARYVGAEVAFADVDPATGLVREANFRAVGPVAALFPVHLNGQVADLEGTARLAAERGIPVVEDACHALGTTYRDSAGIEAKVGACRHSLMTVFSFHAVKTVAMGEGGAITTNDERLYHRLRSLRCHGMIREAADFVSPDLALDAGGQPNPWYYEMQELGFNFRVTDIQCALGLSQLGKLDRFIERRRALTERYDRLLTPLAPLLRPVPRVPGCRAGWHLYAVTIDFAAAGIDRAGLMRVLSAQGIGTQVHYLPVHLQPYYRERYGRQTLPGAEQYYASELSLPLFPGMVDADVDRVVAALTALLGSP